jgi:hypothetical protein
MFERPVEVEGDDPAACADALRRTLLEQRLAGARRLAQAAHWADLHPAGDWEHASTLPEVRRRDRHAYHQTGSDGTPEIAEFAAVELGVLLETTTGSAEVLLRDALDLRHRLPRVWEAVMTGRIEDWRARKAVAAVRPLTMEQCHQVDAEVLDALIGLPLARALDVVHARVIAADPEGHRARREAEEQRRYVSTGRRSNPHGLRTLIAQTLSGDVARLEAMVAHLASLLAAAGDSDPVDTRRAKALGLLANPALACVVLAERPRAADGEESAGSDDRADRVDSADCDNSADGVDSADSDTATLAPESEPEPEPEPGSPVVEPYLSPVELARRFGRILEDLGPRVVDRLRPKSVLYVHLSEEAVVGVTGTQVARLEAGGPLDLADLTSLLGHDRIVVKPVIDPSGAEPVDAHEVPARHREKMRLRTPYEVFPFGTLPSLEADQDHTSAYRALADGGPPGQTRLENLGPLGRRHHRAKTFGGFTLVQPLPGLYLWRTPTGHWFRVDHRGSTALGKETPEVVRQMAPPAWTRTRRTRSGDASPTEQHLGRLVGDWVLAT